MPSLQSINVSDAEKELFRDSELMQILSSLCNDSKSAREVSDNCNIPIPSVYRKLKILGRHDFLDTSRVSDNGIFRRKYKVKFYRLCHE